MTTRRRSPTGTGKRHVTVLPARTPLLHVGYAVFESTGRSWLDHGEALLGQFAALVPKLDDPGAGNELPIVVDRMSGKRRSGEIILGPSTVLTQESEAVA